ncbi:MAG: hypothetical protein J6X41_03460, partial [Spirochaetales bacterium]|nr:hypothetical protein [Spirochaetales bacterium]
TGITTHPEFWLGMFPSSVRCFMGINGLELIPGRITEAGMEIATGTIARTISQDPVTGAIINDSSSSELKNNRYYDVTYAAWKIGLAQGLGWSDASDYDLLTLRFTIDGQWEVALDPLMQITRTGYPFRNIPAYSTAVAGQVLSGTPDLSGNRQLLSTSFDLYGKISDQFFKVGILDGLSMEFKVVWAPSFMTFSKGYGGFADYWKVWTYTEYSKMIHTKTMADGTNKWSLGISDSFEMRILGGKQVPEYAKTLKSPTWWYEPENMTFLAKNTLRLNYYGQQFFGNCIPYIYLFLDMNYSGGKLNNSVAEYVASVWEGSVGLHIELQMFGTLHIYYEIGRLFMYTGEDLAYKPGMRASQSLRITFSLPYREGADWSK